MNKTDSLLTDLEYAWKISESALSGVSGAPKTFEEFSERLLYPSVAPPSVELPGPVGQTLTAKEVAKRLKCHVATVRLMIKDGRLSAIRSGKILRITEDALADLLTVKKRAQNYGIIPGGGVGGGVDGVLMAEKPAVPSCTNNCSKGRTGGAV